MHKLKLYLCSLYQFLKDSAFFNYKFTFIIVNCVDFFNVPVPRQFSCLYDHFMGKQKGSIQDMLFN